MNGEFRALSLGSLAAILIGLGIWALFWGPDDPDDAAEVEAEARSVGGNLDGPVVRHSLPYDDAGDDAWIGGRVELVDGCLVLVEGDLVFPIVWPAATTWAPVPQEVVLPTGERVGLGDRVEGGGGFPEVDRLTWLDAAAQTHGLTCPTGEWGEWASFNNQREAARPG